jgi:carbon-monoxide dehydrogenase medium subunit
MIPGAFEYSAPRTLAEALDILQQHADEAKILAGGQSLIPLMKYRLANPGYLVDINRIAELAFIEQNNGHLRIGALTREADLERSELVAGRYPLLMDTTKFVADPLVRNMATVGGNLAHGDPANDHPAAMLALRAQLVARGPAGERMIPIDEFFQDLFVTALAPDEILTEIRVPTPALRSGGAYRKLERKVGDFATAGAAAYLALDENGICQEVGIGLTNAGHVPLRATRAEDALRGQRPTEVTLREAAELAATDSQPAADLRGSEEYKRAMVRVLTRRALQQALQRAAGSPARTSEPGRAAP